MHLGSPVSQLQQERVRHDRTNRGRGCYKSFRRLRDVDATIEGSSAGARTERAGRKWARAHAQARAEGRRHVAKKIAAARAAAVVRDRTRDVHPQPMTAHLAKRVDALHC